MDGMKSCYGIEYFSNIGRVKYQGSYYDNKRFGKGVLYDRNGVVEHDGLWKSNQPYSPHFDGKTVDSLTALLDVPNSSFNESRFFCLYSFIHSLKRIVIGNECFGRVRSFELNGLRELESIEIGNCSCRISDDERGDGVCRMVNCPKLVSIQIGKESFCDYQSFELTNLPSLLSIGIGSKCFIFASSFLLIGLITGLVYYHRSSSTTICQVWSLCIPVLLFGCVWEWLNEWIDDSDLPKLQSISLAKSAMECDNRDDRKTTSEESFNYKNTLTMRSENEWDWVSRSSFIDFLQRRERQLLHHRFSVFGE